MSKTKTYILVTVEEEDGPPVFKRLTMKQIVDEYFDLVKTGCAHVIDGEVVPASSVKSIANKEAK